MKTELTDAYGRLGDIRALFTEYQAWMGISLDFQDFADELATLPGKYARPDGRLFLLLEDGETAGCAALRPFDIGADGSRRCEMKRLFVRDGYKGRGYGKLLARHIIEDAREIGYSDILLDTFSFMDRAVSMYEKLGFEEIGPYRYNPYENVKYLRLKL